MTVSKISQAVLLQPSYSFFRRACFIQVPHQSCEREYLGPRTFVKRTAHWMNQMYRCAARTDKLRKLSPSLERQVAPRLTQNPLDSPTATITLRPSEKLQFQVAVDVAEKGTANRSQYFDVHSSPEEAMTRTCVCLQDSTARPPYLPPVTPAPRLPQNGSPPILQLSMYASKENSKVVSAFSGWSASMLNLFVFAIIAFVDALPTISSVRQ